MIIENIILLICQWTQEGHVEIGLTVTFVRRHSNREIANETHIRQFLCSNAFSLMLQLSRIWKQFRSQICNMNNFSVRMRSRKCYSYFTSLHLNTLLFKMGERRWKQTYGNNEYLRRLIWTIPMQVLEDTVLHASENTELTNTWENSYGRLI